MANQIKISVSDKNATTPVSMKVYRDTSGDPCPNGIDATKLYDTVAVNSSGIKSYTDTSVTGGINYYYRISYIDADAQESLSELIGPVRYPASTDIATPNTFPSSQNNSIINGISIDPEIHLIAEREYDYRGTGIFTTADPHPQNHAANSSIILNFAANPANREMAIDFWKQGGYNGTLSDVPVFCIEPSATLGTSWQDSLQATHAIHRDAKAGQDGYLWHDKGFCVAAVFSVRHSHRHSSTTTSPDYDGFGFGNSYSWKTGNLQTQYASNELASRYSNGKIFVREGDWAPAGIAHPDNAYALNHIDVSGNLRGIVLGGSFSGINSFLTGYGALPTSSWVNMHDGIPGQRGLGQYGAQYAASGSPWLTTSSSHRTPGLSYSTHPYFQAKGPNGWYDVSKDHLHIWVCHIDEEGTERQFIDGHLLCFHHKHAYWRLIPAGWGNSGTTDADFGTVGTYVEGGTNGGFAPWIEASPNSIPNEYITSSGNYILPWRQQHMNRISSGANPILWRGAMEFAELMMFYEAPTSSDTKKIANYLETKFGNNLDTQSTYAELDHSTPQF